MHGGEPGADDANADADAGDVVRRDRFSGGPARGFLSSLAADERIFAADLAVDRAHVVMLAEQGIVDDADAGAILRALDEIETAGHGALPESEDVHAAIETAVIERVGPEGGRMHTARSRNDEVATCIRYRLRADLLDAAETVVGAREQLLDAAADHTRTVMPGFTHRQYAQPTTVAHYLLSYERALARDTRRLLDAYDRTNQSPLGAAAFAGTTFDVDRERTADLLGFDGTLDNAMDAVSSRDFLLEATGALATLATTLSGLAEDVVEFASDGYLDLSDDYASTSSIMPQKKNPDTLELVRARAGDAAAGLNGLLATLKGLPRAYNRDLQRATGHVWETVDAVTEAVEVAAGAVGRPVPDGPRGRRHRRRTGRRRRRLRRAGRGRPGRARGAAGRARRPGRRRGGPRSRRERREPGLGRRAGPRGRRGPARRRTGRDERRRRVRRHPPRPARRRRRTAPDGGERLCLNGLHPRSHPNLHPR